MEIRRLNDIKQIKRIHKEHLLKDFPENEATPWIYIGEMLRLNQYEAYGLFNEDEFLGYAFFLKTKVDEKQIYLFDYLAITEGYRNSGAGTEFLRLLGKAVTGADCMIGEVEDPDAAETEEDRKMRERRISFYERNGFRITKVKACVRGANYLLVEVPVGPSHTDEEIKETYTALYRQVAPEWFMKKHFRIE